MNKEPKYKIYAFEEICEVARVEIRATSIEEARNALGHIETTAIDDGGVVEYYEGMDKDKGWKFKDDNNVIVGLLAKGDAKKDYSNFVVRGV